ncbi:hypothetical protein C8Q74DRAFT_1277180 [Fomes fomentarius]|nr:hypothetical protein C8Q74DRAFT_1277180 [Fomes fomentarius]
MREDCPPARFKLWHWWLLSNPETGAAARLTLTLSWIHRSPAQNLMFDCYIDFSLVLTLEHESFDREPLDPPLAYILRTDYDVMGVRPTCLTGNPLSPALGNQCQQSTYSVQIGISQIPGTWITRPRGVGLDVKHPTVFE